MTLAVLGPAPSKAQLDDRRLQDAVVVSTGQPLDWMAEDPGAVATSANVIARLAERCGADIVHLNSPALAGEALFPAPVVGVCHSCLATWWAAVRGAEMPAAFVQRTAALARGYRACDVLLAPSRWFVQTTQAAYGVSPRLAFNGLHPGTRRAHGCKRPIVLTSGRLWDEGKNFAAIDRAAASMQAPVYAAGPRSGPDGTIVEARAARLLGPLAPRELDVWLNTAAVYVSLARYEPFGLGVLEAAQAGCALVLADTPVFRELWWDAARFVAPDDAVAAARLMTELIENPVERQLWGRHAAARAKQYARTAMIAATLEVYASVSAAGAVRVA